ncbi:hypothetical protein [Rhodospirillum sp. A1_3_36]|uniref:hypothetical protein n=1 Tax=Rhodospirillum sp. A1_3_36 TaxID=3391666 RepID=UPI0039A5A3FB
MAPVEYPSISDYKRAVGTPHRFKTLRHHTIHRTGPRREPWQASGNVGVVFQTAGPDRLALKCFFRDPGERLERYRKLESYLASLPAGPFVKFTVLEDEIEVAPRMGKIRSFPVLSMDWVDGKPLGQFLDDLLKRNGDHKKIIKLIYESWKETKKYLKCYKIAHGDIKQDNIIVRKNGGVSLVDYDNVFFPSLRGKSALEVGSQNFQHPNRNVKEFDENFDFFSNLVVDISLLALAEDTSLFQEYHNSENLIFSRDDFINYFGSALIHRLKATRNSVLAAKLEQLEELLASSSGIAAPQEPWISEKEPYLYVLTYANTGEMKRGSDGQSAAEATEDFVQTLLEDAQAICLKQGKLEEKIYFCLMPVGGRQSYVSGHAEPSPISVVSPGGKLPVSPAKNWKAAGEQLADVLAHWGRRFPKSYPPTVVWVGNQATEFSSLLPPSSSELDECCVFAVCPTPEIGLTHTTVLCPDRKDNVLPDLSRPFLEASALSESMVDYGQRTFGLAVQKERPGVLISRRLPMVRKFLEVTLLGPLIRP